MPLDLYGFDRDMRTAGLQLLAGVDEAGRGPLAGPVYAAAVILPEPCDIVGLRDSKKLTPKGREALSAEIREKAVAWAIAGADEDEIDAYNILEASHLAMRRAVEALEIQPQLALVDGNRDPMLPVESRLIVRGDGLSACIAAASILAKVGRDAHLRKLDEEYPQYGFAKHKGYPTKEHYEMLNRHGPCAAHRRSFLVKWSKRQEHED